MLLCSPLPPPPQSSARWRMADVVRSTAQRWPDVPCTGEPPVRSDESGLTEQSGEIVSDGTCIGEKHHSHNTHAHLPDCVSRVERRNDATGNMHPATCDIGTGCEAADAFGGEGQRSARTTTLRIDRIANAWERSPTWGAAVCTGEPFCTGDCLGGDGLVKSTCHRPPLTGAPPSPAVPTHMHA